MEAVNNLIPGSSPRVWGTRLQTGARATLSRFIPTGVGNTPRSTPVAGTGPVHPHGCGEHPSTIASPVMESGSSPRVWGTRDTARPRRGPPRFIPTGVGNTLVRMPFESNRTVHPHGCGEHAGVVKRGSHERGSSPRVWGTPHGQELDSPAGRFIPTGVGNTNRPTFRGGGETVHPHGCGEHTVDRTDEATKNGSSPRVWGTRGHSRADAERKRFIPTGVGNTRAVVIEREEESVHPHGCGEHLGLIDTANDVFGSSPRVWGTRRGWIQGPRLSRFIPTGVGNTPILK